MHGLALACRTGMLTDLDLRQLSRRQRGDALDVEALQAQILGPGALPPILQERVSRQ